MNAHNLEHVVMRVLIAFITQFDAKNVLFHVNNFHLGLQLNFEQLEVFSLINLLCSFNLSNEVADEHELLVLGHVYLNVFSFHLPVDYGVDL